MSVEAGAATGNEGLAGLDRPVRTLFERIAAPAAGPDPDLKSIGTALVQLAADLDYVSRWAERLGDVSGSLAIHGPAQGPRLTIIHRSEGQMGAVHDHGTWVAISPIVGLETHRRYRVVGEGATARPELAEALALEPSHVATLLPPDDLHDHGHLAGHGTPAYVLIMTGDDQTRFTRNEWDLATGRHRILRPGDGGRWLASQPMPPDQRGR
jgi:predicted metal-dependent enzyme (double-stranded beta helix superfamily)